MIYWLCFFLCSNLMSSFAYPPFYNMPEANPPFLGPNVDKNYGEYSDSGFDPQWNPWHLNSQPDMHPFRNDFLDSGMNFHYNQENMEETPLRPFSQQHRKMKFNNTLKRKQPTKTLQPYSNYQSNRQQQEEDTDDYETEEDNELSTDIGNSQLPSNEMISTDNTLEMNKNFGSRYENKRDDGSLSNVYQPEISPRYYPDMDSKFSERKGINKLENNKRNSYSFKTVDNVKESIADSSLYGNENENLNKFNRRGMQSLRNVDIADETLSNVPKSLTNLNNQNAGVKYEIDKQNDMSVNNMKDDGQSLDEDSELTSNNNVKDEYFGASNKRHNDNLMLRDTNSDNNKNFFQQSVKVAKNPRASNKTKVSEAAPKLTFYNEDQSNTNSERSKFTSENPSHLNKRMNNDKYNSGGYQFPKYHKTKSGRDPLHHMEQKLGRKDHNLHQGLNPKTIRHSAEKIHESSKGIFNNNEDDKILSNYQMNEKQQKKSIVPQEINYGRNDENVEKDLLHDNTKNNPDMNLKSKKSAESGTIKNLEDSRTYEDRDSFQVDDNDPNKSKKRSVEIRHVNSEKGSATKFQRNLEKEDKSVVLPEIEPTSKTVLRSPKNFKFKNRINYNNRQATPHKKHLPLAYDTLSNRKPLHPPNPFATYGEHMNPKYDSNGRNQKREPEYIRPTALEVKELSGPHNYELNIAKQLINKKGKVDEKLSRTMEDYKIKKTILKDAKTNKETNIVENENEKIVDKVHVISDPNPKTPPPPLEPANVPLVQAGRVNPYVDQGKAGPVNPYVDQSKAGPVNPYVDQSKAGLVNPYVDQGKVPGEESPEEEFAEQDTDDQIVSPDQQIVAPTAAEEEEMVQGEPQNAAGEDYYGEVSKDKVVPDNYYDIDTDQANEAPQKIPVPPMAKNKGISNQVQPNFGYETNEAYQNYNEEYSDYSQKSTEDSRPLKVTNEYIPPAEDSEPMKVSDEYIPPAEVSKPMKAANEYIPPAELPTNLTPQQANVDQIYLASPPPSDIFFQDLQKNILNMPKYKAPDGKWNKHKKIYHFSTEYAVSYGMDEFEKEEKLEKASKTVVRNKLMTANESSHHFQEKKTEIKNNKESYHEAFIEEKDENKFPREMDNTKNPQRSIPASNQQSQPSSENDGNPNSDYDPDYTRGSVDDSEFAGSQEYDDQSGEYSGRVSERFSPSDDLNQHENLIDNVKRSQPSLKISRDANADSSSNNTRALENLHDGRHDANPLNRGDSNQEIHEMNSYSNLEDSPSRNKEVRDSPKEWKGSDTTSWTAPHSESKSGNVVYITMRTTTMDIEKKYHDFIHFQDEKRTPGRYERHPKHYRRQRRKNKIENTFGP